MSDRHDEEVSHRGRAAWLSHGFEELVASRDCEPAPGAVDFDVVIVGSGYGGAIAASRLAGGTKADGNELRVGVLERGREYLPGMFPSTLADLASHVRFSTEGATCARGEREGLFDVRIGADVSAVVANGLGGGSLINAGVMAEPCNDVFDRPEWPRVIRDERPEVRQQRFRDLRVLLGAALRDGKVDPVTKVRDAVDNTVDRDRASIPAKFKVLERMAPRSKKGARTFRAAPITVALTEGRHSSAGVALVNCLRCGDCATGCNHGAKDSLDVNLLRTAERAGAKIYTGATVLRLERHCVGNPDIADDWAWLLDVVHTDLNLRVRQGGPFRLVARKVILAAGTYGSTEILLRSRSDDLVLSRQLGQRYSTNGDMIAVAYDQRNRGDKTRVPVNAIADERDPPQARAVGPTITGIIDLRADRELIVEEMAVPGPLRRVFEEIVTTGNVLRSLARIDKLPHDPSLPDHDPCAVEEGAIRSSSILATMGNDGAGGALELVVGEDGDEKDGDGAIRVRWPEARDHLVFQRGIETLEELGRQSQIDSEVQSNPVWQLLPKEIQFLFDDKRGAVLTVHPLGGCPMGDAAGPVLDSTVDPNPPPGKPECLLPQGVVNDIGQVFDGGRPPATRAVFRSLVVLDGSIVPTSLGINPSLTIAALALRAIPQLCLDWGWNEAEVVVLKPSVRPVFQVMPDPPRQAQTEVEVIERMSGEAMLPAKKGGSRLARIELTLHFEPVPLESLFLPLHHKDRPQIDATSDADAISRAEGKVPMRRPLKVDRTKSRLRVFDAVEWRAWRRGAGSDRDLEKSVQIAAPLSGSLVFLQREASTYSERRCRALLAWVKNRGLRDTWQALASLWRDWLARIKAPPLPPPSEGETLPWWQRLPFIGPKLRRLWIRIQQLLALASHAGEVRLFDYDLVIEPHADAETAIFQPLGEGKIRGFKRVTYSRRSNPWRQMARMSLDAFPGLRADSGAYLDLDLTYLTQEGVPLIRVVKQDNQVAAMSDLGALAGYFLRLLMSVHVWSFRKPDPADLGEPQRLPGEMKGLDGPEINEFVVANLPDGRPVRARLTRYPRRRSEKPPLLMIPGYSASGTTFAHPALDPHAAGYFWERGRDVWILDMRTSCGMPTARLPWTFEEVALADIPKAIDFIWQALEKDRRDAIKGKPPERIDVLAHCMGSVMFSMALLAPPEPGDLYFREREAMPERVRRVVLSQIGPVVVFTPANVFRAYLMSYLRNFLPLANYEFRVGPAPSLTDQLIDRLLATMPYPEVEFDIENPWRPPCKRTPWVGSRHRMDALYGRDFNVENVSSRVLDAIDDLFGPLSTDTVSQAIHFARLGVLTNRAGRNVFVTRRNLVERWTRDRPTMSIHGEENGLYDVATLARMEKLFKKELDLKYEAKAFPGMGHQDSLIGKRSGEVFAAVEEFLDREVRK